MRPSVGFTASSPSSSSSLISRPRTTHLSHPSAWHSPVPYLFGGLAAMLGLIAFALLILACSYWKLSGDLDDEEDTGDVENGGGAKEMTDFKAPHACVYEQRVVVIMAGDEKPTFLGTPISSRASSFGDRADEKSRDGNGNGGVEEKKVERVMGEDEESSGEEQSSQGHQQ